MRNLLSWLQAFASSVKNSTMPSAQSPRALLHGAPPPKGGRKVGQISGMPDHPCKSMILPCTKLPRIAHAPHLRPVGDCRIYHPHVLQAVFGLLDPKRFAGPALLTHPRVRPFMRLIRHIAYMDCRYLGFVGSEIPPCGSPAGQQSCLKPLPAVLVCSSTRRFA